MFSLNPGDEHFLSSLEFLLKLIGAIGGLTLFIIGLYRYTKDQGWKRNEFVAKEIKEFTSDKMVRNTMSMLDWGDRYIELFPDKSNYEDRYAKVDREILKRALQYHRLRIKVTGKERFTSIEVAIRDHFDHFLSYLERFEQLIEARLITAKKLKPYLKYWILTIAEEMEGEVRNVLYHYIDKYGFTGVQELFKRYKKDIKPKTDISSTNLIK